MLTYGSLFTGIGGFDLGLERAGFRCAFQVEIDPDCGRVLARHWPGVARYDDVDAIEAPGLPAVDLLCGGFPCQDLSVAGRRAGLAGKRSGLFRAFMRLAAGLAPRWLLIENVPGLLSSNEGRDMGVVVGTLGQLGYGWAYRVLDAQYFGVAQRRRRVFIVGCAGDPAGAAAVLFEPESGDRDTPPRREARERVTGPLADSSGKRGWSSSVDVQMWTEVPSVASTLGSHTSFRGDLDSHGAYIPGLAAALRAQPQDPHAADLGTYVAEVHDALNAQYGKGIAGHNRERNVVALPVETVPTMTSNGESHKGFRGDGGHVPAIAHTLRAEGADASEDGTGRGTPLVVASLELSNQGSGGNRGWDSPDSPTRTLDTHGPPGVVARSIAVRGRDDGQEWELGEAEIGNALRAGDGGSSRGNWALTPAMAVRRLTPRECERLQGFPDDYTAFDATGKAISDSARYRMLGNAIAVPVAEWIARRLAAHEAGREG